MSVVCGAHSPRVVVLPVFAAPPRRIRARLGGIPARLVGFVGSGMIRCLAARQQPSRRSRQTDPACSPPNKVGPQVRPDMLAPNGPERNTAGPREKKGPAVGGGGAMRR